MAVAEYIEVKTEEFCNMLTEYKHQQDILKLTFTINYELFGH